MRDAARSARRQRAAAPPEDDGAAPGVGSNSVATAGISPAGCQLCMPSAQTSVAGPSVPRATRPRSPGELVGAVDLPVELDVVGGARRVGKR